MKRNALQKFIQGDISKETYDDFVATIEEKLQGFEMEKLEIKKVIAESHSSTNLIAIKKQLNEFLQFNNNSY